MAPSITVKDLPPELLELEDDRVEIVSDPAGNLLEVSFSSAPDLSFPSIEMTLTIDNEDGSVKWETVTNAHFPDPDDDPTFYQQEDDEDIEAGGEERDVRVAQFADWALNWVEQLQYNTEVWRKKLATCSFCQKHQNQVGHIIAGPEGLAICNECVDLCEDVLAEEGGTPP